MTGRSIIFDAEGFPDLHLPLIGGMAKGALFCLALKEGQIQQGVRIRTGADAFDEVAGLRSAMRFSSDEIVLANFDGQSVFDIIMVATTRDQTGRWAPIEV